MNNRFYKSTLFLLFLILIFCIGFIFITFPSVSHFLKTNFQLYDFYVLETNYYEDDLRQIADQVSPEDPIITYEQTDLEYYPFAHITFHRSTASIKEQMFSIWDLSSGEMIHNLDTWQRTTGFRQILDNTFGKQMIEIIKSLTSYPGQTKAQLQYSLNMTPEDIDRLIRDGTTSNIFTTRDDKIFYLYSSSVATNPSTETKKHFKLKPYSQINYQSTTYSLKSIIKLFEQFYGDHHVIDEHKQFYVPYFTIKTVHKSGRIDYIQVCGFSGTILSHQVVHNSTSNR